MLFAYHVDVGHVKAEDQQQQQNVLDDSTVESAPSLILYLVYASYGLLKIGLLLYDRS